MLPGFFLPGDLPSFQAASASPPSRLVNTWLTPSTMLGYAI